MWDAFERMKMYDDPTLDKKSVEKIMKDIGYGDENNQNDV